ncbi:MAG: uroporphyrinogen decarboxylase family protein [Planctomycetota bacterium]
MNSRQRVLATLNREPTDRPPFEIGGTDCSSVHVIAYKKLRERMGLADGPIRPACLFQLAAQPDADVMDALEVDVEALWFGSQKTKIWKTPFGVDLVVPERFDVEDLPDGSSVVRNPAGVVYAKRAADAYYHDPAGPPLAKITSAAELDQFDALFERWDYSYTYDEPLEAMGERAKAQYESTERAVVSLWRMHYLQAGMLMRGYEQFLIDLMVEKDLAHALLAKLHRVYMERIDAFLGAFGDWFDIVFLTDDLGTQKTGMISPAVYREMIFPYISEVVGKIKAAGKKVLMHSCGAVSSFVPFLIEMGIDALNPVQVSADGMNPADLVRQYGKDIAFWGGGCDTQHALNASDPEVVRADVRRRLREFGPEASLVFTQVHNIQYDVAPENILAMRDEFWKQTRG